MQLATFISDLSNDGKVVVASNLVDFQEQDLQESKLLLTQFYNQDVLNMPLSPPLLNQNAAVWAARYLYRVIQFICLRNFDELEIEKQLVGFEGEVDADVVYSADLTFRHLPQLIELATAYSPVDFLTQYLIKLAQTWPFSSVGIDLREEPDEKIILSHSSLRIEYIDRIILMKDIKRINNDYKKDLVGEALGDYSFKFWPNYKN